MLYRRFGRTELQMPVFSTGGMRYQHGWKDAPLKTIPKSSQDNLESTIRRSLDEGINHIETARGYGPSERQLGLVLPKFPREELIVQTKIAPCPDAKDFRKQFFDSLRRLRLDHVDLLSLHGLNHHGTLHDSIKPGGCLEECRKLVKEGYVRFVGFSTHGMPHVIDLALRTDAFGGFDYYNVHWYWIFQRNWPTIETATRRDQGVFIISPSDKGGKLYAPPKRLCDLTAPLHPIHFNNLFCLSRPEVHTLSLGAARPSDYDLHVESLEYYDQREELVPAILDRLEGRMADVFGEDFARDWQTGVPDWDRTPGEINIVMAVSLYMLAKAYGMIEYAKGRYNLIGNAGHWFPGRQAEVIDKPALRKALADAPYAEEIIRMLPKAHRLLKAKQEKRLSES